tara:strand:+ start:2989 stop:3549 length:561 start_codon:yes stop_codon:yes gene_type:complete
MRILIFAIFFLFLNQNSFAETEFKDLQDKKTSYLDFVLSKIESRLVQRHGLLGAQMMPVRVQFQSLGSQVDFFQKESKIVISIQGVMDKSRYSKKKYIPKITDCNILRNILLYGKQGYHLILKKRNKYLTDADMKDIFIKRFLNNLSLSEEEKNFILKNTFARVQIIDPVRGNDVFCSGNIAQELN